MRKNKSEEREEIIDYALPREDENGKEAQQAQLEQPEDNLVTDVEDTEIE